MKTNARALAAAVLTVIAGSALAGCSRTQQTTASASPSPSYAPAAATPSPLETPSPAGALSSAGSPSPPESSSAAAPSAAAASAEPTLTPSPMPTLPTPPPGLARGWEKQSERTEGGPEADLVVRTGDIDNLGYGWPPHFTPFSGESTPAHPWPCAPRFGAAPGTDRIMLGTGVTPKDQQTRSGDGYAGCSKRPDNLPEAIPLEIGALPATIHGVFFQMFVDDFQAPVWHSHFQVSLNGTRIPSFEDAVNALDQTGPIGKLLTLRLLPEYWPLVRSGTVKLLFDDPTTGALDGYAIDFVRVLVNPHGFRYGVIIHCTVVDAATQKPIAGASVSAAQVTTTTGSAGTCALRGVPAGLVSVGAGAVGYDSAVQLLDLPAGHVGTAAFTLKRHTEGIADLKAEIARSGSVAVYGIHFDTASAKLRPDSTGSLDTILQLIKSSSGSRWIIAGHTDNQGGAAYNLGLAGDRAHSVVTWLTQHGIDASRLTPKGYGLTRPVADNATASGRALNRRVEVSLVK